MMTDAELARFVGIPDDDPIRDKFIAKLNPTTRALFERMANVETEWNLYQAGLGPKPTGVLLDTVKDTNRRRTWR
jgi:hypothetical protein